jgi:hypothetical protein
LIEEEDEDTCVGSPRENRRIVTGNNEFGNKDNNAILLRIQGADLRRFDKYKKRLNLTASLLWYNCKKRMLKQECNEVGWVSIPSHLLLYTMHLWSDLIASSKVIVDFVDKEQVWLTFLH